MMIPFDFQLRTRIVFGPNKIDALGELSLELGAHRVLVVSDPGVVAAGHTQRGIESLTRAGLKTFAFNDVHENPSTADVEAGVEAALRCRPDLLVGLGGGSAIDCAKGINFVYTGGGVISDYWGVDKAQRPMLPMIAVPSTAGTGSEVQSFALISDARTHAKMACGDKKAACRVAVLDPKLTLTQPARVTGLAGIDALAHALETFVSRRRNPASVVFSLEAWRLLAGNFARVLDEPGDLEARASMQLGACFAGVAIEHSMLGAAHALANPLTARYRIPHGEAVGMMLPEVVRFNGVECGHGYGDLLHATAAFPGCPRPDEGVEGLARFLAHLGARAGLAASLSECGVDRGTLPQLAAEAAQQWTGRFNPRPVGQPELLDLYRRIF